MASDTVPAAVPNPAEPPSAGPAAPDTHTPAPGGLAGLLAPVQPARSTAFTLPPISDLQDAGVGEQTTSGVNSAAFHDTENPQDTADGKAAGGKGGQERSVVRAWLLAGAERWKKGGDARLKRLDIAKARAQAFKEARQVRETRTVNRAEKMAGGSTNSSTGSTTNAGKRNSSKTTSSGSGGVKNGLGGSAGHSGGKGGSGGGTGSSGSGSGGAGRGGSHRNSGGSGSSNSPSGGSAGSGGRGHGGGSSSGSGPTPGGKGGGKHDSPAKPVKNTTDRAPGSGKTPASGSSSGGSGKAGPSGAPGKPGKDAPKAKDTAKAKDTPGKTPNNPGPAVGPGSTGPNAATGKTNKPAPAQTDGQRNTVDLEKKPKNKGDQSGKTPNPAGKTQKTHTPAPAHGGPRLNTQASRETGYRDGTRAAKLASHVEAWRDGARDGWNDTREAAAIEKTRLDKAHADRKNAREKDQPVNKPASSADYQQAIPPKPQHAPGTQPIQVTGTDASHIHLGDGANRASLDRGEVRSLRSFQRRLNDKTDRMTQIAEATRTLEQHAQEQAKNVTRLLEQAKAVKGGDKLIGALTKLEEAALLQAGKAAEIHQRAARAAEACKALHDNADTRYGAIYKAAQDSGDLAEMNYYKEMAHA